MMTTYQTSMLIAVAPFILTLLCCQIGVWLVRLRNAAALHDRHLAHELRAYQEAASLLHPDADGPPPLPRDVQALIPDSLTDSGAPRLPDETPSDNVVGAG